VLTEIILGGAAGAALYQCHRLDRKVFRLERRLRALEQAEPLAVPASTAASMPPPAVTPAPAPRPKTVTKEPIVIDVAKIASVTMSLHDMLQGSKEELPPAHPKPQPVDSPPLKPAAPVKPSALQNATTTLLQLVRDNPFVSAGVLLVLVSFGFLFSLLAASNILPPAVRVGLVALAGAAAFGYATRQEKARPTFAMNLQGGAIALQFLCALWAYEGYELVGSTTAFIWMGGISAAAVGWAAHRKQGLFAFLGIAGSLLTPIVASTGSGTFSGLLVYSVWVSALGLGISRYLGMPTLMSTALAGVGALLCAALGIHEGSVIVSQVALLALLGGYVAIALSWTAAHYSWAERQRASIVGVLVSTPLLVSGLLYSKAGVSAGIAASLLGAVTLLFLVRLRKASDEWQAWLLPIAGGLGVVALATGLDGANRAIAFSGGALGFVLVARAKAKRWMDVIAFAYWGLSVLLTLEAGVHGISTPLIVSGLVALGAGFLMRSTTVGMLYGVLAPLALWYSVCADFTAGSALHALWFSGWAMGALYFGRRLGWREMSVSAAWVPLAGLCFLPPFAVSDLPAGALLYIRELAFITWLAVTAYTLRRLDDDNTAPGPNRSALEGISLAIPALLSYEGWRLLTNAGASREVLDAAMVTLWSAWCFITTRPVVKFNFHPRVAGGIGAALLLSYALFRPLGTVSEGLVWLSLALLGYVAATSQSNKRANVAVVAGAAGVFVVSTALRAIGLTYNLPESATLLLFSLEMQPWVSLLWAGAAIATVVWGSKTSSRKLWMGGGIAIGVLLLKMLFVDLATFSLAAKVGVFMVTGLAFIALGRYAPASPAADQKLAA